MPKPRNKAGRPAARDKPRSFRVPGSSWQLQTAKARFSELFRRARAEGPQLITRQGKEGVVMISGEQFDELVSRSRQPRSLVDFFRRSPLVGVKLDWTRNKDVARDIE